jgi:hypothetical protein
MSQMDELSTSFGNLSVKDRIEHLKDTIKYCQDRKIYVSDQLSKNPTTDCYRDSFTFLEQRITWANEELLKLDSTCGICHKTILNGYHHKCQ